MKTQITCPECSAQIDVNDILKHQLEDTIRKEFLAKEVTAKKALEAKEAKLNQEKEAFELQKSKEISYFIRGSTAWFMNVIGERLSRKYD